MSNDTIERNGTSRDSLTGANPHLSYPQDRIIDQVTQQPVDAPLHDASPAPSEASLIRTSDRLLRLRNALSDCQKSAQWAREGKLLTGSQPFYTLNSDGIIYGSNQARHTEFQNAAKARGGRVSNPISHTLIDATHQAILDLCVDRDEQERIAREQDALNAQRLEGVDKWAKAADAALKNWRKYPHTALVIESLEIEPVEAPSDIKLNEHLDAFLLSLKGKSLKSLLDNVKTIVDDLHAYRTWHDGGGAQAETPVEDNADRW